jgi:hypothetical protein
MFQDSGLQTSEWTGLTRHEHGEIEVAFVLDKAGAQTTPRGRVRRLFRAYPSMGGPSMRIRKLLYVGPSIFISRVESKITQATQGKGSERIGRERGCKEANARSGGREEGR